jgi:hypothetical protein
MPNTVLAAPPAAFGGAAGFAGDAVTVAMGADGFAAAGCGPGTAG